MQRSQTQSRRPNLRRCVCSTPPAPSPLRDLILGWSQADETLARTRTERLIRIYDPTHVLLDAQIFDHARAEYRTPPQRPSLPFSPPNNHFFPARWHPNILSAALHVLIDRNHLKIPFFSESPTLHAAHIPSTILCSGGQAAPGAETTGHAQIGNALGAPFVLELWKACSVKRMRMRLTPNPIRNKPLTRWVWTLRTTWRERRRPQTAE